jgi:hypothetical protein
MVILQVISRCSVNSESLIHSMHAVLWATLFTLGRWKCPICPRLPPSRTNETWGASLLQMISGKQHRVEYILRTACIENQMLQSADVCSPTLGHYIWDTGMQLDARKPSWMHRYWLRTSGIRFCLKCLSDLPLCSAPAPPRDCPWCIDGTEIGRKGDYIVVIKPGVPREHGHRSPSLNSTVVLNRAWSLVQLED